MKNTKKAIFLSSSVFFIGLVGENTFAQVTRSDASDNYVIQPQGPVGGGPARPFVERALKLRTGHVLLGLSDEDISTLKRRRASSREVDEIVRQHLEKAEQLVGIETNKLDRDPRRIENTVEPLVLAYRVTGDRRYADKLRDLLTLLASQKNWVTDRPLLKRDPVWNSDLGMGFTAMSYGFAYDAIRETLTPEQRKILTSGLMAGVVEPVFNDWIDGSHRIHTLDTMGHNWWAHIVFGTGVGLAAIARDDARAVQYLKRLDAASVEWWGYAGSRIEGKTATFDADGGYSESLNYADLAIQTYLEYRLAWKAMIESPPSEIAILPRAVDFLIHNAYPATGGALAVNFGDSSIKSGAQKSVAAMWALGYHKPEYLWYLNQYAQKPGDYDVRQLPRFLVHLPLSSEDNGSGSAPTLPTTGWFRGMGWATLRTSWDKDATLLSVRSGFTWNHNHADAGSFILFHKGKPLLIDSGKSSYARSEYDEYYRQSEAHNVVTLDGRAEAREDTYFGSQNPGQIPNVIVGGGFRYIFADATGPTSATFSRNFRQFLWVDGVILVIDNVKAYQPGKFEWLLHPEGDAKRDGQALKVRNGDAGVDVVPLFPMPFPDAGLPTDYPENMRLERREGMSDQNPDLKRPYFAFVPANKTDRVMFVTALIPSAEGSKPEIQRFEGSGYAGIEIRTPNARTKVYLNLAADGSVRHRNSIGSFEGFETDANLLAVRYDAKNEVQGYFVGNGSYLRSNKELWIDSLSKRFVISEKGSNGTNFWAQGQADAKLGVRTLGVDKLGLINGKPVNARADKSGLTWILCCDVLH